MYYVTPKDYEIAEQNGISAKNVTQRVYRYGWDIKRAITQPLVIRRKVDPLWEEWKDIATANGIVKKIFNQRINRHGWTAEKAATTPVGKAIKKNGKWTAEEIELAKKNGLDKNYMDTVKARIRLGWSREEALSTPILTADERAKRVVEGTRRYHKENGRKRIFN
ncbi:hypothetical protein QT711_03435 [Sporosarcina saromensis]|uniref:Uncharacterized protein n=1 Tax=Sporosarcina saromensis TaxID=359365 RepID=A0ABU4G7C9_9BACL|nr:hypothetical protein [Sporosarcina saromensis]MDW0112223.1 hypothetical protein [Sporosarcina saromensis]